MSISFSFATRSKEIKKIKNIYSKDIAFKQCKEFIENYFSDQIEQIPVNSTSAAVTYADKQSDSAAFETQDSVGENNNVSLLGMPAENDWVLYAPYGDKSFLRNALTYYLYDKIEDSKNNHTRFVILSSLVNKVKSKNDKTSVLVNLSDGHGVLAEFLQAFHDAKINLTKLESRPAKRGTDFKYVFYIDFEGHYLDNNVQIIFKAYEKNIKLLGSYPRML